MATQRWVPILLATLAILAIIASAIVIIFLQQSETTDCLSEHLDCETLVEELLVEADASQAPALLESKACLACHSQPSIAPPLVNAAALAAARRPPLSTAAYLYEAIVYPNAYILPGYQPTMPLPNLEPAELAAIIAYLLDEAG